MEDYKKTRYCTQIQISRDGQILKSLIFNQDKIIIGRILSVDLVIDDISISRIHAAINVEDSGSVTVSDLGSVNGVKYNGEKITECEISSGGQFTLGDIDIQVTVFKEEEIQESPQPRVPIVNYYSELEDIVDLKKKAGTRTMVVTPKEGGRVSICPVKLKLHIPS